MSAETRQRLLAMLSEGHGVRATARALGLGLATVVAVRDTETA